ncbi:MAG: tetratricopeptide repeat protein [Pseudooceanicola sp.]
MRPLSLLAPALASLAFALPLHAAGSDSGSAPKPTETTTKCQDGEVYDEKTKTCVDSNAGLVTDDLRYAAVRELSYAGRYDSALMVIDSARNAGDPRFLNYRGFIARMQGDLETAMQFYNKALEADPGYLLARSYMGQGLIAQEDHVGALAQLREIEARGGRDSWAYAALDRALRGQPTFY